MFRQATIHLLGLAMAISLFSGNIFACACCAEPGTRMEYKAKTDSFIRDLVKEFKFATATELYMTEAGFDAIEGIDPIRKEDEQAGGALVEFSTVGSSSNRWVWASPKGAMPQPLRTSEHLSKKRKERG